jgi:hypothetical protein
MSYTPTSDFIALLRNVAGGESVLSMPGLDWVIAALARAGFINLYVGQTAPTVNQPTTVWFKPSQPSWVAEGTLYIWNTLAGQYQIATPALWDQLASPPPYSFQSAPAALNTVSALTSLVAIERVAPAATTLLLPTVLAQSGKPLQIVDWSSAVVSHAITLTPSGGNSIMQQPSWELLSTPDQPAGVTLYPSVDLNGWVIAP